MDANFWLERWQNNQIGFHEAQPNPMLVNHFKQLNLSIGSCVFVPLCGKTLDIAWLLSQGNKVVGAELSQLAIEQLFNELGVKPKISEIGKFKLYSHQNIDIYVGDIFDLTADLLGQIDAIYDRAAMVALPEQMRILYAKHMMAITNNAPILQICFEYDQSQMSGPPFSVTNEELHNHYAQTYKITQLDSANVENVTPKISSAVENVWVLK